MPEMARVLAFPPRTAEPLSKHEARTAAHVYVAATRDEGAGLRRRELLAEPDVLTEVCGILRDSVNAAATMVAAEAVALYRCISDKDAEPIGAFDETDYFLGETALLAGTATRILGRRDEAENWFDRAEAGFRHTVNPSPLLARVTYQRLALRCEKGHFREVAELAPMLAITFGRLNMASDRAKSVFLQGMALKQACEHKAALSVFCSLNQPSLAGREPGLLGLALVHMADIHAADGRDDLAEECCADAIPLLERGDLPAAVAQLHGTIGEALRRQGKTASALEAYGASIAAYDALGMSTCVAYLRIVTAQTLLEAGMHREAEWQILAALPTIEEQQMVAEGVAAVALLRESVRLRKTDPMALSQVREYLQAKS